MSSKDFVTIKYFPLLCALGLIIAVCLSYAIWSSLKAEDAVEPVFKAEAGALRELKEKWKEVIAQKGGEIAYADFLEEAPKTNLETHGQAHAFGEALYEVEGIAGLKACDSSFEFGCYHSFFGVAVYNEGIETLPQFDAACNDKFGRMSMPCQHGIGHGVLVYTDYENIEDALKLCETISTQPTGGCSSGVFMEYNFHTMDEASGENFLRPASGDLYAPCNTLPERFWPSCYFEQVQWWQNMFDGDFDRIATLCEALPAQSAAFVACYNGAGNYAAAQAHLDAEKTQQLCARMKSDLQKALCHEGASWLMRANPEKEKEAPKMCEALAEPFRTTCFQKLDFSS